MQVFISWSGDRSHKVAEALRAWLPNVLQALEPWLSSADITAGSRWHQKLGSLLADSNFGIICLTPENQTSKWLLYEAGALSKSIENSRVVPYLVGLRKADVEGPLSHFQAAESDKEGTLELIKSLNTALQGAGERALSEGSLQRTYDVWWPELDSTLEQARTMVLDSGGGDLGGVSHRDVNDMITEIVENTRSMSRRFESLLERAAPKPDAKTVLQPKAITPEVEAVDAVRKALLELLPDLEKDAYGSMEPTVERWKIIAADPAATFETLNSALASAKDMRRYLDR